MDIPRRRTTRTAARAGTVLRSVIVLVLFLLLGALLAACGSDEDDGPSKDNFEQSQLSRGQTAPDFTLSASDGSTVSLSDYTSREQPVMLFFHMADG